MGQRRILIVDESTGPLATVANQLRQSDCVVFLAQTSREALEIVMEQLPDVVVLSQSLKSDDSLDFCRSMFRHMPAEEMPAILLTPLKPSVLGLNSSSNARLAESIALDLLAQSVKTLTFHSRRIGLDDGILECHGIRLDPQLQSVELDGIQLELTPTEFRVLRAMLARPGHVLTRDELEEAAELHAKESASGGAADAKSRTRRIDVHVKSIRSKLLHKGGLIETVRGIGYRVRDAARDLNSL